MSSSLIITDHDERTKASGIILIMALITVFFCFISIVGSNPTTSQEETVDDENACQLLQTATSCLIICIVPMGDLLLEWINCSSFFNGVFTVFGIEHRKNRAQAATFLDTSSLRMNLCERTMFVVGVVCLGGNQSFPANYSSPLRSTMGIAFSEISGVFARSSIVSLFCRISPTMTPRRSIGLTLFVDAFHVVFVCAQLYPASKTLHNIVLFFYVGCVVFSSCLILLILYDMFKPRSSDNNNEDENGTKHPDVCSSAKAQDVSEQRLHNVVIMIHIFAAFFPGFVQILWDSFGSQWSEGTVSPQQPHIISIHHRTLSNTT